MCIILHLAFNPSKAFRDAHHPTSSPPELSIQEPPDQQIPPVRTGQPNTRKGPDAQRARAQGFAINSPISNVLNEASKLRHTTSLIASEKSKLRCLQTLKHMYNRVLLLTLWLALLAYAGKLLQMYMLGMGEHY